VTAVLWQVPFGSFVLYPFTILATWFHEMGHGLTSMVLGGEFTELALFPNGSGLATHRGPLLGGPLGAALVSAGGLLGPPIAGAGLIIAGTKRSLARLCLVIMAGALVLSVIIWIRTLFGIVFICTIAACLVAVLKLCSIPVQQFLVQFLGVQACVSSYRQLGYLFTHKVVIGGREMLSDTGQIQENLLLPYWFWGALVAVCSAAILFAALAKAFRGQIEANDQDASPSKSNRF